jgi:hypothetical protein
VQCFHFYSLLLAANIITVDYFSLDIEGQEFNVLKTIPWRRVDIKVRDDAVPDKIQESSYC